MASVAMRPTRTLAGSVVPSAFKHPRAIRYAPDQQKQVVPQTAASKLQAGKSQALVNIALSDPKTCETVEKLGSKLTFCVGCNPHVC